MASITWSKELADGFRLIDRWGSWDRSDFTAESTHQIAVFQKG
jgi:hypothetical protein